MPSYLKASVSRHQIHLDSLSEHNIKLYTELRIPPNAKRHNFLGQLKCVRSAYPFSVLRLSNSSTLSCVSVLRHYALALSNPGALPGLVCSLASVRRFSSVATVIRGDVPREQLHCMLLFVNGRFLDISLLQASLVLSLSHTPP
jgi:hypothetical protein